MARLSSRTINPLHFEDLEPHRFEDLVRQLVYDFRPWSNLEATGRTGKDEGFDVRGRERGERLPAELEGEGEPSGEQVEPSKEREWLIQCKREKTITPKRMEQYVKELPPPERVPLHGVILAAPTDYSKATRDVFIHGVTSIGVQEWILWGRAELEDLLFQPKNDHLLFAYFGFSLAARRRSTQSSIRGLLATKRKCVRLLGPTARNLFKRIVVRDAEDVTYPRIDDRDAFLKDPRWMQVTLLGHRHDGLAVITWSRFAYISDDGNTWDYVKAVEMGTDPLEPWEPRDKRKNTFKEWSFWNAIPEGNRAKLVEEHLIPYEKIVDVDENGDEYSDDPHVYALCDPRTGFFGQSYFVYLEKVGRGDSRSYFPEKAKIKKYFPDEFPEPPPLGPSSGETTQSSE